MDTSELALVFFSILAQLAVGTFLVLGVITLWVRQKVGKQQSERLAGWGWWAILIVMVLALVASLTHLGNVKNAYLSILNLETAWLSREILFALLFTGSAGLYAFLTSRKVGSNNMQSVLWVVAAIFGIALVFSMSMIYSYIRTQPAWNSPFTTISFFITTLLLGSLGAGVVTAANYLSIKKMDPECKEEQCGLMLNSLKYISIAAIAFLGLEIVALPIYLTNLAVGVEGGIKTVEVIAADFSGILILRLLLGFLGAGLIAAFVYRISTHVGQEKLVGNLTYLAFLLVLVAETLGRFIFYLSNMRVGV